MLPLRLPQLIFACVLCRWHTATYASRPVDLGSRNRTLRAKILELPFAAVFFQSGPGVKDSMYWLRAITANP